MSKVGKVALHYVVVPLICMTAYYFLIAFSLEIVRSLVGADYMKHDYAIYTIEGAIGIAICFVWFHFCEKFGFHKVPHSAGKPEECVYAVVSALAMLGIAALYFMLISKIKSSFITKSMEKYNDMMTVYNPSAFAVAFNVISSCILIPILEEMVFRGIVFEGMLQNGRPVFAIIFSALCFGVMHGQIIQIGYACLAGIALALVYYISRNLVMSILAHMVFNFLGNGIFVMFDIPQHVGYILSLIEYASILVFIVASVFFLVIRKREKDKKDTGLKIESEGEKG